MASVIPSGPTGFTCFSLSFVFSSITSALIFSGPRRVEATLELSSIRVESSNKAAEPSILPNFSRMAFLNSSKERVCSSSAINGSIILEQAFASSMARDSWRSWTEILPSLSLSKISKTSFNLFLINFLSNNIATAYSEYEIAPDAEKLTCSKIESTAAFLFAEPPNSSITCSRSFLEIFPVKLGFKYRKPSVKASFSSFLSSWDAKIAQVACFNFWPLVEKRRKAVNDSLMEILLVWEVSFISRVRSFCNQGWVKACSAVGRSISS